MNTDYKQYFWYNGLHTLGIQFELMSGVYWEKLTINEQAI